MRPPSNASGLIDPLAVALKEGQALLKQYTDRKLKDPVLRKLCALVTISDSTGVPSIFAESVEAARTVAPSAASSVSIRAEIAGSA